LPPQEWWVRVFDVRRCVPYAAANDTSIGSTAAHQYLLVTSADRRGLIVPEIRAGTAGAAAPLATGASSESVRHDD